MTPSMPVLSGGDAVPGAREFRTAMAAFATGVTVVTTTAPDGERYGMTVNAFSSVSLDPLLLLVCLRADSRGLDLIHGSGVFTTNVLTEEQQDLSRWFADGRRPADSSVFDGIPVGLGATGCPVLLGAAASFDCRLHGLLVAGDHVVVTGSVVALTHRPDARPLLFHAGGYGSLAGEPAPAHPHLRVVPD
ncbi:MAG: flavin reductase [Blastococcus sp.]|nr:flavin reductase [Blastococcus sp.]